MTDNETEGTSGQDAGKPREPDDREDETTEQDSSGQATGPSEEQATAPSEAGESTHWATRVRVFVDEAVRIAKEDLADKEVTFEDTTKRAEELIRQRPLEAVGMAAGVGLLAGILINRKR